VNVVLAVSPEIVWLPDVAFVPLQPPLAVQDVALVEDQVSCVLPPDATLVGLADRLTVGVGGGGGGAALTVTVAEREIEPPVPVQLSE
jgi:hypothetical protein